MVLQPKLEALQRTKKIKEIDTSPGKTFRFQPCQSNFPREIGKTNFGRGFSQPQDGKIFARTHAIPFNQTGLPTTVAPPVCAHLTSLRQD